MFTLCQGMRWTHLPNGGGLYDQDPILLDDFMTIFEVTAVHEREEREKREREQSKKANVPTSRMRGGPRSKRR